MGEWRPRLKTDAEILAALEEEMKEDLAIIEGTDEQRAKLEEIDKMEAGFVSGAADGTGYKMKVYETNDLDTIVPGFSKGIPALENSLGVTQSRPATINEALNEVNPAYDPNDENTSHNCVNSVIAYECQRNGYRVQALPVRNDIDGAYITNAFSAFNLTEGEIERASEGGNDLLDRLNSSQFPNGSRFIVSQRWYRSSNNEPGHDYIAEKINDKIRFVDGQQHLDDASSFLDRVQKDKKGRYILHFARIDNKTFIDKTDLSRIVTNANIKLDNSVNKYIIYNKETKMTKEDALELLKGSPLMEPGEDFDGPYYRVIGEYQGETETTFNWVVYWTSSKEPDDRTYAFMYFVNKNTKEVSHSSAPLEESYLKYISENHTL
jgi:hypothetical protein